MKKVYLFKRYERMWHWLQAIFVMGLIITGFGIHGSFHVGDFEIVLSWHEWLGLGIIFLTAFTMFWHATTGEGRHFIPTKYGFFDQVRYYTSGIFRRMAHPNVPSPESKFNPVQKAAYFSLLVFVFPVQLITGFLLWGVPHLKSFSFLSRMVPVLAMVHTLGAFAVIVFVLIHLYMITTGKTILSNLNAMITGWTEES